MSITDFFNYYQGLAVDFDGVFGNQCTDLIQFYNKEVIGGKVFGGNAKDFWQQYDTDFYEQVANTPTNVPLLGDIVIWNANMGSGNGHVAIFGYGNVYTFASFDQNFPTGSRCHFQEHDYTNITGWLHPKK